MNQYVNVQMLRIRSGAVHATPSARMQRRDNNATH
jgi:hypothetical protein